MKYIVGLVMMVEVHFVTLRQPSLQLRTVCGGLT